MPYDGQRAILTTMHGKHRAVARPLRVAVGLDVGVTETIDTDLLGSFSGEHARTADARTTALAKARLGMAATGLPLGLASEGTFAPHPAVPFVSADHEVIAFIDATRGIELVEATLSVETNHGHFDERERQDLEAWLVQVRFPSHAVIVRPRRAPPGVGLTKGITTRAALEGALRVARAESADRQAIVETDMRAHVNPLRMRAIGRTAARLARRLACRCPRCGTPGFGRVGTLDGLPCELCRLPTPLVREERWGCLQCPHEEARPRADGRRTADAGECPQCNP